MFHEALFKVQRIIGSRQAITGHGVAPNEFWLWQVNGKTYPVLVTQAIAGLDVKTLLDQQPEALHQLDAKRYSQRVIMTLLTSPDDDKPANQIYHAFTNHAGKPSYELVSIDYDRMFAPAFVGGKLGVKTLLYHCPQWQDKIHPEVVTELLALNPLAVLQRWLTQVDVLQTYQAPLLQPHYGQFYVDKSLYKKTEAERTYALPLFPANVIGDLFYKLQRLQDVLGAQSSLTHYALCDVIHPKLTAHYAQHNTPNTPPAARFKASTEGCYQARTFTDKLTGQQQTEQHSTTQDMRGYLKQALGYLPERQYLMQTWINSVAGAKLQLT